MRKLIRFSLAALMVGGFVTGLALAQHEHGGSQAQGSPAMPNMGGIMAAQQTMRNVEMRLNSADSQMRDLAAMHATMTGSPQHDRMVASMQAFLGQMRKLHESLNGVVNEPMVVYDKDMMSSLQQASRDLDQMAKGFESMTKNMNRAMKSSNVPKK